MSRYPADGAARTRFVLDRRPARQEPDIAQAPAVLIEEEPAGDGGISRAATIFLVGRECPWRCVMCDLWRNTLTRDAPAGAIAAQVRAARQALAGASPAVTMLKLYNAGSFFDPRAVPDADAAAVAPSMAGFDRVVVESHPALVGARTGRFRDALEQQAGSPRLEVAMGLETVHPVALDNLNKRMTLDGFRTAARRLRAMHVDLRVFLLVSPPFVAPAEQLDWLARSLDEAWACGASVVSLIPTRTGNGAMEALEEDGLFTRPTLRTLERSLVLGLTQPRPPGSRVLADLWDLDRHADCTACLPARRDRLRFMNRTQAIVPPASCAECADDGDAPPVRRA
jgi:radical SAM enzyme (TIGR01210 family)